MRNHTRLVWCFKNSTHLVVVYFFCLFCMKSFCFGQDVHSGKSYLASTAYTSATTNVRTRADRLNHYDYVNMIVTTHCYRNWQNIAILYLRLINQSELECFMFCQWNWFLEKANKKWLSAEIEVHLLSLIGERQKEVKWETVKTYHRVHGLHLSEDWNLLLRLSKGFRKWLKVLFMFFCNSCMV